jgi:hypothetical protein
MSYVVMKIVGFASGAPCPIAGQYLKDFDFEAYEGLGHGEFTPQCRMQCASAMPLLHSSSRVPPRLCAHYSPMANQIDQSH